jgi:hypothetical protein
MILRIVAIIDFSLAPPRSDALYRNQRRAHPERERGFLNNTENIKATVRGAA